MRRFKPPVSDVFKTLAHQVEKRYDGLRARVKRRMGWTKPPTILPYRGYGNDRTLYLTGRVLESRRIRQPQESDTWYTNAKGMYRRFATDEFGDARVQARGHGIEEEVTTDEEGYFQFKLQLDDPLCRSRRWHDFELELLDQLVPEQDDVRAIGQVLIPPESSEFGVISDMDDTVIESHATDFATLVRLTVFKNIHSRTPLEGVSLFYRALEAGLSGNCNNPFFYVSSSAWNLYDVFADFLALNDIPAGPILLRDLGIDEDKFIKSGHEHKIDKIEHILDTCHSLPFVLIGDAGQDDPVLYREVLRRHPNRVRAIYIRAVSSQRRNERALEMAEQTREEGVPMKLVRDIGPAMRHASEIGLLKTPSPQHASNN